MRWKTNSQRHTRGECKPDIAIAVNRLFGDGLAFKVPLTFHDRLLPILLLYKKFLFLPRSVPPDWKLIIYSPRVWEIFL